MSALPRGVTSNARAHPEPEQRPNEQVKTVPHKDLCARGKDHIFALDFLERGDLWYFRTRFSPRKVESATVSYLQ